MYRMDNIILFLYTILKHYSITLGTLKNITLPQENLNIINILSFSRMYTTCAYEFITLQYHTLNLEIPHFLNKIETLRTYFRSAECT